MFCKYCGVYTDNENGVCDSCASKEKMTSGDLFGDLSTPPAPESTVGIPPVAPEAPAGVDGKYGLKKSIVGAVFSALAMIFAEAALAGYNTLEQDVTAGTIAIVFCALLSIGFALPGIIIGSKSLKNYNYAKSYGVKPLVTYILGIVSIVQSAVMMAASIIMILTLF